MTNVLNWISLAIAWLMLNLVLIAKFQQGLCIAGSAVCQLFGWTKASKWFGTFALVDLGRIIRVLPIVWGFVKPLLTKFRPTITGLMFAHWAIIGTALGMGVGGALSSCAPKNTFGAQCPANAICDKVDFGTGAVTVCLSPSDLAQLQAAAARTRAATKAAPDGGAP